MVNHERILAFFPRCPYDVGMEMNRTPKTTPDPGFVLSRRLDAEAARRETRRAWITVLSFGLNTLLAKEGK